MFVSFFCVKICVLGIANEKFELILSAMQMIPRQNSNMIFMKVVMESVLKAFQAPQKENRRLVPKFGVGNKSSL